MPEDFIQTTVRTLQSAELEELALKLVTGDDGLDRTILRPRVQKPGLAFAGYYEYIKPWRVQIIGESETKYLQSLPARLREKRVRDVAALDVSCFIVTKGITPLDEFKVECEKRSVPLFSTPALSSIAITRTTYFLEETMAPKITMHSGLLDVYGIGVLLLGDSGIGKSECALDLVYRGHRLIADDMVVIKRHPNDVLLGYSNDLLRHHMELRGIGIIDIKDLFGVASTRDVKPIDLVVRLEKWVEGTEYDRLGIEESEWMPECNATYKCGITFENWSTRAGFESYFHPFASMLDNLTVGMFVDNAEARLNGADVHAHPNRFFISSHLAANHQADVPGGDADHVAVARPAADQQ